jgi:hypothetical protein
MNLRKFPSTYSLGRRRTPLGPCTSRHPVMLPGRPRLAKAKTRSVGRALLRPPSTASDHRPFRLRRWVRGAQSRSPSTIPQRLWVLGAQSRPAHARFFLKTEKRAAREL